jgi:hypothetical protein
MVSEHAGFQAGQEVADTDSRLFELQQIADTPHTLLRLVRVAFGKRANIYLPHVITAKTSPYMIKQATATNNIVIRTAESLGVRSYIFVVCIVYREGEGFGNCILI